MEYSFCTYLVDFCRPGHIYVVITIYVSKLATYTYMVEGYYLGKYKGKAQVLVPLYNIQVCLLILKNLITMHTICTYVYTYIRTVAV